MSLIPRRTTRRPSRSRAMIGRVIESLESRMLLAAADLDPTFGEGGKAFLGYTASLAEYGGDLAVLPDGRFVIAGSGGTGSDLDHLVMARYMPDGTPDPTFGEGGKQLHADLHWSSVSDLVLSDDGSLIAAGGGQVLRFTASGQIDPTWRGPGAAVTIGASDMVALEQGSCLLVSTRSLVKLRADGTFDPAFGTGGQVSIPNDDSTHYFKASKAAVAADGSIVVAGARRDTTSIELETAAVRRYTADGQLDTTFGVGGTRILSGVSPTDSSLYGVEVLPDGKIIVNGHTGLDSLVARLDAAGTPDAPFGASGVRIHNLAAGEERLIELTARSDGRFVGAGIAGAGYFVASFEADGRLNRSFGAGGLVERAIDAAWLAIPGIEIAVQPDDQVLMAFCTYPSEVRRADMYVKRVRLDGSFDASLGIEGELSVDFKAPVSVRLQESILQPDGKVVFAGVAGVSPPIGAPMIVGRLNADGTPDHGFGRNGIAEADFGLSAAVAITMAMQPDGKLLVAGYGTSYHLTDSVIDILLARFNTDGSLDASFGQGGKLRMDLGSWNETIASVAVLDDGRIVATVRCSTWEDTESMVMCWLPDGRLDEAFGTGGRRWIDVPGTEEGPGAAVAGPGGMIYVSGTVETSSSVDSTYVARLKADGSYDESFGAGGVAVVTGRRVTNLTLDPAGGLFLTGADSSSFILARMSGQGLLDPAFGTNGIVTHNAGLNLYPARMALLPGGGFMLAGARKRTVAGATDYDFMAQRLRADGTLDASFGVGGAAVIDLGSLKDEGSRALIGGDGRVIIAGTRLDSSGMAQWAAVRLAGVDAPPPVADAGGPYALAEGQSITLAGSGTAPDGVQIVEYQWDLDYNGTRFDVDATGAAPSFPSATVDGPSSRMVAMRVIDSRGQSTMAIGTVTVLDSMPALSIGGADLWAATVPYTLHLGSEESGADTITHWTVNWGDGPAQTIEGDPRGVTHVYAVPGTYVITASAANEDGTHAAGSMLTVQVLALSAAGGGSIHVSVFDDADRDGARDPAESPLAGRTVYVDANGNGALDADEISAVTDGDGMTRLEDVPPGLRTVRQVAPLDWAQIWPESQEGLEVLVWAGQASTGALACAALASVPRPSANAGGPYSVAEGGGISLAGTGVAAPFCDIAAHEWDLNYDGVTFDVDATGAAPVFSAAGIDGPATRTVALRVRDTAGLWSEPVTAVVSVTNAAPVVTLTASQLQFLAPAMVMLQMSAIDPGGDRIVKWEVKMGSGGSSVTGIDMKSHTTLESCYSAGKYTVVVRATDDDGMASPWQVLALEAYEMGSIAGKVYHDNNDDGTYDSGDWPLTATIYADLNDNSALDAGEPSASSSSGSYKLSLMPGDYKIRMSVPSGYRISEPFGRALSVTIGNGTALTGMNFGAVWHGSVSGRVFNDVNGDGVKNASEAFIAGRTVYVDLNGNGTLDEGEPSSAAGVVYDFDLYPGTYQIRQILPPGWVQTLPADNGPRVYTIESGIGIFGLDFGVRQTACTIAGVVFDDADGNGSRGTTELGVSGFEVYLDLDGDGTADAGEPVASTDAGGNYIFLDLAPGTYYIRATAPAGWRQTYPTSAWGATFGYNEFVPNVDFGLTQKPYGTISGTAFRDDDGDRTWDASEPAVSGRTIYVDLNRNGALDGDEPSAASDADGRYTLGITAPGTYQVRQIVPAGWLGTYPNPSWGYHSGSFSSPGAIAAMNFGAQQIPEPPTVTITGPLALNEGGTLVLAASPALAAGQTIVAWEWDRDYDGASFQIDATGASPTFSAAGIDGPGSRTIAVRVRDNFGQTSVISSAVLTIANVPPAVSVSGVPSLAVVGEDISASVTIADPGGDAITLWRIDWGDGQVSTRPGSASTSSPHRYQQPGSYTISITAEDDDGGESPAVTVPVQIVYGSVSGQVFDDLDGDGTLDAGEAGMAAITVRAVRKSAPFDAISIQTDASGRYSMQRPAGVYDVEAVLPEGYQLGMPLQGRYTIDVRSTQPDHAARDFAAGLPGTVSGIAFHDRNANGVYDASGNEDLQQFVTVYVDLDKDGKLDAGEPSMRAGGAGAGTPAQGYEFHLTPGTYQIRQVLPPGWAQTAPAGGPHTVVVRSGEQSQRDFGLRIQWSAIVGTLFEDSDGDASQDAQEVPLQGRSVFLDLDGDGTRDAGEAQTATDSEGRFAFTSLLSRLYVVRQVLPADWVQTLPASGAGVSVSISATTSGSVSFGSRPAVAPPAIAASVRGTVFDDANNNGLRDAGEAAIAGRTVWLDANANGAVDSGEASATTDGGGAYSFTGLYPDTHTLRIAVPSGWRATVPASPVVQVVTAAQEEATVDFGQLRLASISGLVYSDLNVNFRQDGAEPGLSGWTVFVDANANNALDSGEAKAITNSAGFYTISGLLPGTCRLVATHTASWRVGAPAEGYREATVAAGDVLMGESFGAFQAATVTGVVYDDLDADGQRDGGEPGLPGRVVFGDANDNGLLDAGEISAVTDGSGIYQLGLPAGQHKVRQALQAGWQQTSPVSGAFPVMVTIGQALAGRNFGAFRSVSITGRVLFDANANAVADQDETGLQGWTVYLDANGNGLLDASETFAAADAQGRYTLAGLAPGQHRVSLQALAGWVVTSAGAAVLDLASGQASSVDFLALPGATITGTLYSDANGNGVQDAGEAGLAGQTLWLDVNGNDQFDPGEPATVTDAAGFYQFTNLLPGTYDVRCANGAGWMLNSALPEELTLSMGQTAESEEVLLKPVMTISGCVFNDANADGWRQTWEAGLAGRQVFLDANANGIRDTSEEVATTDAAGQYLFGPVLAGSYRPTALPAAGWRFTGAGLGGDLALTQNPLISGRVFVDANRNRRQDAKEKGFFKVRVFVDRNNNARLDKGEISVLSDRLGNFTLASLPPGKYTVRVVTPKRYAISGPKAGLYKLNLAPAQLLSTLRFGLAPVRRR